MKLNPKQSLIQPLISEYLEDLREPSAHNSSPRVVVYPGTVPAIGPKPPTPEAVAKAQFVDKTYVWRGSAAAKAAGSEPRN